jgi:hypothetical protein
MDGPVLNFNNKTKIANPIYTYSVLLHNGQVIEVLANSFYAEADEGGDAIAYNFVKHLGKEPRVILTLEACEVRVVANADEVDVPAVFAAVRRKKIVKKKVSE